MTHDLVIVPVVLGVEPERRGDAPHSRRMDRVVALEDTRRARARGIGKWRRSRRRSAWTSSGSRQAELPREPVSGAAAVAIRAVVGVVPAVLDDQQLHGPRHALRQLLGV